MQPVDLAASFPHYLAHALPVWRALPEEARGTVFVSPQLLNLVPGARPLSEAAQGTNPVLVAGADDLNWAGSRPIILMEHGIGQSYTGDERALAYAAYAGGTNRWGISLFLVPNEYAAAPNREAHPEVPVEVIGSPRLAELQRIAPPPEPEEDEPLVVALAFHWFAPTGIPEMEPAFNHWCASDFGGIGRDRSLRVLGHGHPRSFGDMVSHYQRCGIEPVEHFEEVLSRAHVLIFDNTSAGYEFAALRGPVVVADAPWYRPEVSHGLRFWDAADIGPRIEDPAAGAIAARQAWANRPWPGADELLARVFPPVPDPAAAAASAILRAVARPLEHERAPSPFPRGA